MSYHPWSSEDTGYSTGENGMKAIAKAIESGLKAIAKAIENRENPKSPNTDHSGPGGYVDQWRGR